MSYATLERAILNGARTLLNNSRLRMKDIAEWSTSEKCVKGNLGPHEVMFRVPDPGVWIAVDMSFDKRPVQVHSAKVVEAVAGPKTIRTRVYGGAYYAVCKRVTSTSTNAERCAVEATALKLFGIGKATAFNRSDIQLRCVRNSSSTGARGEWHAWREGK